MHILLLIDSLAPGGAQRQICLLANGLAKRGHSVVLLTYHAIDFFDHLLVPEVRLVRLGPHRKWQRVLLLRRAVRRERPEAVIAFLEASSLYAELGGLPWRNYRLIVSERNLDTKFGRFFRIKTLAHLLADVVAPNSEAQAEILRRKAPWLRRKIRVVPNIVETDRFRPGDRPPPGPDEPFRVLTLGRYQEQKNGRILLEGFAKALERSDRPLTLDWFGNRFYDEQGRPTERSREYQELCAHAERLGIADSVRLEGPVRDVEERFRHYNGFVLASRHEGCPNVILEAMASSLPVLATAVSDNGQIIEDGKTGFLFRPDDSSELSEKLLFMSGLSWRILLGIGCKGRKTILKKFAREIVVRNFENYTFKDRTRK